MVACDNCGKQEGKFCFCKTCMSELAWMLQFADKLVKTKLKVQHPATAPETYTPRWAFPKPTKDSCVKQIPEKDKRYEKHDARLRVQFQIGCIEKIFIQKSQALIRHRDRRVMYLYNKNIEQELIKLEPKCVPVWLEFDKHKILIAIV